MAHDRQVEPLEPMWPHDPTEQGSQSAQDLPPNVCHDDTATHLRHVTPPDDDGDELVGSHR
jgi:hypothetical protein